MVALTRKIVAQSNAWVAAQVRPVGAEISPHRPSPSWLPPPLTQVKVNVDGALRKQANVGAASVVIRDS